MNALKYAIACKESYNIQDIQWIKSFYIGDVWLSLTRIDDDFVAVLRGSITAEDWIRDFEAMPEFHHKLGWCHAGFLAGMDDMFAAIKNITGGDALSFTGHSLGGARARILAGLFIVNKLPVKNLVTFGSPKPAFPQLAEIVFSSSISHVSYRNNNDIVPTLPETMPFLLNFVHTENYIQLINNLTISGIDDHNIDLYIKGLENEAK